MSTVFTAHLVELGGINSVVLGDADALASLVVAAAGAIGIAAPGPPVMRQGRHGVVAALVCGDGHIVLHAVPDDGRCLVDVVAHAPAPISKGLDVIARRLGASVATAIAR